jgi:hypothetical protein
MRGRRKRGLQEDFAMLRDLRSAYHDHSTVHVSARRRHELKHCDVCGMVVEFQPSYLVHPASRRLMFCCETCATNLVGGGSGKYRRVPKSVQILADLKMSDAQWDSLSLPINLAFLYYSSPDRGVLVVCPSASGPNEIALPAPQWEDLVRDNPILRTFQPDVEGLLINRVGPTRRYFRAPIDQCFKLTAFIKDHWSGVTGGVDIWRKLEWCFDRWKHVATTQIA